MSDFVVGLTGGIGSGKSTVADLFVEQGATLVDTDAIAHELTGVGGAAMPALVAEFGAAVAAVDGAMDRAAMRQLVFADPSARVRLEGILHPLIRQLSAERCRAAGSPYVILAVPLLVESGTYRERCDRIVVVDCPESLQIERVMARNGMLVDEVKAIMAVQATRQQRLAVANDVVVNDADQAKLHVQVAVLHRKYLMLSAEKVKASC
ncbi:dephospho-CoA kinase [Ferribacterium limneticum]|uniref:dephospho-CoA kinase n=1 Tax=Ferribacterium limneticum TaxID=76259 RepID=UPI001CFA049E|nr:dephospho-CoA kinase [Ferribacterium limneticum]UCV28038.1 dephospho-CoA kinase [Ferribacterium limneticum]UCV31955.1 dephospho-CoA kinase [Ferribacterium limneticum]